MRNIVHLGLAALLTLSGPPTTAFGSAAAIAAASTPAPAATSVDIPASAATSSATPDRNDMDRYVASQFAATHFPGMSIEIVDADGVRFASAYGDVRSPDTPLIIGSLSKSVTAVAIMQLVADGMVDLEAPFASYLPDADQTSTTTVRQLLTQTSGIRTNDTLEDYATSNSPAPFEYANTNYALLGQIVAHVSGKDYGAYLREHITGPLGMTHTSTSLAQAKADGLTPGHRNYFGAMVQGSAPYPEGIGSGWSAVPAGYIISSANDMGRYLQMLLGSRPDVLNADGISRMTTPAVDVEDGYAYGMGLEIHPRGGAGASGTWVVHSGNVENYTTYMILVPSRGIAAIAMFDACDFLVANDMAIQLTENVVDHYMGNPTADLDAGSYVRGHAVIDGVCALVLVAVLLPLLLLGRWARRRRIGRQSAEHPEAGRRPAGRIRSVLLEVAVHFLAPTAILALFPIAVAPLRLVRSFVPDVFLTAVVAAGLLYITGIAKVVLVWRAHRRPPRPVSLSLPPVTVHSP